MPRVWIDLENTPHVLFLEPFMRWLARAGHEVLVTAKPQSQTLALAAARGLSVTSVGAGDFEGSFAKVFGGGTRALALMRWVLRVGRPAVLISSSRSASLAAAVLRIPGIGLLDYEHSAVRPIVWGSASLWMPDLLRAVTWPPQLRGRLHFYPGLKENLYLDGMRFDRTAERHALGVPLDRYGVVARPPASSAHYANDQSDLLWHAAIRRLLEWPEVEIRVSARTDAQQRHLESSLPRDPRIRIHPELSPGPGLVAGADLVLGGGGTMNREAAVLGIPVWSTFCGPSPAIDEALAREGRLRWVRSASDLDAGMEAARPAPRPPRGPIPGGFEAICADLRGRLESAVGRAG